MGTYTAYNEIARIANDIPDARTRRAVMKIADELSEGTFENKIQGVALTATAAELNQLDGAIVTAAELSKLSGVAVTPTEMDQRAFNAEIRNVSAAKSVYTVIPWTGDITTIYAVGNGTTLAPTADVFSFGTVNAGVDVKMSGNIITVTAGKTPATGSSVTATAGSKAVTKGDVMRLSCNGGSTGPAMNFVFTVLLDIT